ncbi:Lanosterol synthase (Oxidosqualene--lanosterol cyclase) [Mucor velutinosus]|uniref:Protein yippee-like n=1 Tax=Mucor velutinosus TaxID=708070 RepID=A0AAN7DC93_9FUNG|nr:Lanosterol synthase (Oxidosqualene--lanosterol cyclase) [Mucor velutinosus]
MVAKRHPRYLSSSTPNRQQQTTALYLCSSCHSELFDQKDIISRAFQGRHGQAFLIHQVINISIGDQEERMLMTGLHTVADISCSVCCGTIGWVYIKSPEMNQKYKENKFIIEKLRVIKEAVV